MLCVNLSCIKRIRVLSRMTHSKCAEILIFPFVKHLYLFEIVHAFQRKEQLPFALISLLHIQKTWLNKETEGISLQSQCSAQFSFFKSCFVPSPVSTKIETSYLKLLPEYVFSLWNPVLIPQNAFQMHVSKNSGRFQFLRFS